MSRNTIIPELNPAYIRVIAVILLVPQAIQFYFPDLAKTIDCANAPNSSTKNSNKSPPKPTKATATSINSSVSGNSMAQANGYSSTSKSKPAKNPASLSEC